MKTFVTQCIVGTIVVSSKLIQNLYVDRKLPNIQTEGEGNGKKISKKRAAENMLIELRKLPPVSPSLSKNDSIIKPKQSKRRSQPIKKKARNLIKENADDESEDVNPISRLLQVSQNHKAKDPVYNLVTEAGTPRRREFIIEVLAVNQKAEGVGSTKKQAKRNAAESKLLAIDVFATLLIVLFQIYY